MAAQLVAAAGCTAGRQGSVSSTPDLIERAEIEQYMASGTTNLHELIQRAAALAREPSDRSLALETVILVYATSRSSAVSRFCVI